MDIIIPDGIIKGTLSLPKKKDSYIQAKLQRIKIKDEEVVQLSLYTKDKVYHKNCSDLSIKDELIFLLEEQFNNMVLFTSDFEYIFRVTSKGKLLTNRKKTKTDFVVLENNTKKKYLLTENMIIPPLIDLGVMTKDGKIVKAKYQKFKQINRFLEIVEDSLKNENKLKIIDFGCGKSYLTFIMYYYFIFVKKIDCEIIGLDLKEDVVDKCNQIALNYGYDKLKFFKGDISNFKETKDVDMIVTLHACDTATDYALYHAIKMNCKYIFSVPCCQHEINNQLGTDNLHLLTKYGIIKERLSALYTDAIRANILQYFGYKTQVLEFIDFDASPKNLLIRAVLNKENIGNQKLKEEIEQLINDLGVNQTLYNLLFLEK